MSLVFSGQRPGERVLFMFRRHVLTARKGLYCLFFSLLISFIPVFIWSSDPNILLSPLIGAIIGVVLLIYYYVLWYFTIYIVTNERIRQISQKSFFQKTVVDLDLTKVQGISYTVPGLFASLFNYGTIIVQTIVGDLIISYIGSPEKIYNKLQNTISFASKGKVENDQKNVQKED